MDRALEFLAKLYTETPWVFLSWPAAAMLVGTIVPMIWKPASQHLGITPRSGPGAVGIATAPFLHTNLAHFMANLPPFVGLGSLVLHRDPSRFPEVAGTILLATGFVVWVAARKVVHVGMSGVVFGFLGYLIAAAWFTRSTPDLIVAGGVLLYYGGMLAGVAPVRESVSWESHLFGLLIGIGRAWIDLG